MCFICVCVCMYSLNKVKKGYQDYSIILLLIPDEIIFTYILVSAKTDVFHFGFYLRKLVGVSV